MRFIRNRLRVGTGALIVIILAGTVFAQETPKATATRTRPTRAASRPGASQPATFQAHATLGPALPIPEIEVNGKKVCSCDVYGPVWDGAHNGLWIVLQKWTFQDLGRGKFLIRSRPATALLIDVATGEETRRLDVPNSYLVGHDGVGLWFKVLAESANGGQAGYVLQRVRTAPSLTSGQEARGDKLPEDVSSPIPVDAFRIASAAPEASVATFWGLVDAGYVIERCYLSEWFMDARTRIDHGWQDRPFGAVVQGGGYVWMLADSLRRARVCRCRSPVRRNAVYALV